MSCVAILSVHRYDGLAVGVNDRGGFSTIKVGLLLVRLKESHSRAMLSDHLRFRLAMPTPEKGPTGGEERGPQCAREPILGWPIVGLSPLLPTAYPVAPIIRPASAMDCAHKALSMGRLSQRRRCQRACMR